MKSYTNFVGIDIGKYSFVIGIHGKSATKEYANNDEGFEKFLQENQDILPTSLCIIEATGGYELALIYKLIDGDYNVHRADACKVKNFIRSFGSKAKTDSLDAKALARYGSERSDDLELFSPNSKNEIKLYQLMQRRKDLTGMLVSEKNRRKSPSTDEVRGSIDEMIKAINEQIVVITEEINQIISSDDILKEKRKILRSIPGIGEIVSFELLIMLPELGKLSRRKIASLAGVAPRARDSGNFSGYRRTGHGREGIKPILFIAAMGARNAKGELKKFYEKLVKNGKKKLVALMALMRKIIVIANAKLGEIQT